MLAAWISPCYKLLNGDAFKPVGVRVFDPAQAYDDYKEELRVAVPSGSLCRSTIAISKRGVLAVGQLKYVQ
ncbi:MAG: hypothetical protein JJE04_24775 [Acidobacteriia bacterium]|nr:hypothetical protein [Terriglobia bacterium]